MIHYSLSLRAVKERTYKTALLGQENVDHKDELWAALKRESVGLFLSELWVRESRTTGQLFTNEKTLYKELPHGPHLPHHRKTQE